ncbi:MAG: cobalt-precorrin-5B (C(1))-methyltransferase CbiD [Massilibacteroides sp.]|nr:cobalt-precorrin-5B (C(1))-methyltransferase CbiD [Massilibacteroides sp.]
MILIFGGTTEGRNAVVICEEAGKPFYYSTKSDSQIIKLINGIRVTGDMDEKRMLSFCEEKKIRLIVDAAHPFAEALHQNVTVISKQLTIPVIRYERNYFPRDNNLLWFESYDEVIAFLKRKNINSLLALTGVNSVSKLKPYWQKHTCWVRILDRKESRNIIKKEHFPLDKILYYGQEENETQLFNRLQPEAILIKESGDSGRFNQKVKPALTLKIPILVIKRPILSSSFVCVYGKNGLRKNIEVLLPDFFELRTGYTTGTCATAATKAALIALFTKVGQKSVEIALPEGELINISILSTIFMKDSVSCSVLKDAGDDPDITNGQEIVSTVRLNATHNEVRFLRGKGVGIVTLPGLGLSIGEPAINETPRKMIRQEILKTLHMFQETSGQSLVTGIDVTLSIPKGEELAKKTFNPKLGIVGGISIIGTSGIVKPFSSDAFIASIRREMQVAKALGCEHIVINSGAKSERFLTQEYPMLPNQAFIHYGNFIGETIKTASELGFKQVTMGIMIGKAVKLAEGHLNTHSKKVVVSNDFLLEIAQNINCSTKTRQSIQTMTMTKQLWNIIPESEYVFFARLIEKCYEVCKPLFLNGTLEIIIISEKGDLFR